MFRVFIDFLGNIDDGSLRSVIFISVLRRTILSEKRRASLKGEIELNLIKLLALDRRVPCYAGIFTLSPWKCRSRNKIYITRVSRFVNTQSFLMKAAQADKRVPGQVGCSVNSTQSDLLVKNEITSSSMLNKQYQICFNTIMNKISNTLETNENKYLQYHRKIHSSPLFQNRARYSMRISSNHATNY